MIEIGKTEILDNMRDRFNPVVQILFSEAQAECLNRSRACNHLMVRLGLGSVDISDHVVVQEAGGKREREVQLTDVANEVKIKTAVIHDLPVVLDLSRTGVIGFVDDPGLLEGHLINRYILPGEENLDFTVVVLSDDEEKFILEMDYEIIQNDDFAGIYKPGTEEWIEIKFDRVTEARLWSLDEIVRKNSGRMV